MTELDRLRGEVARMRFILDLTQSSLDLAVEAGKTYKNPTLHVNCERDLELVRGLFAKEFGAPEAAVIKAATMLSEQWRSSWVDGEAVRPPDRVLVEALDVVVQDMPKA